LDGQENELFSQSAEFELSPISRVSRPWTYVKEIPSFNVEYDFILGTQYYNKGSLTLAEEMLNTAYNKNPNSLRYSTALSLVLMRQEKFERARNILLPFVETEQDEDFGFLDILGRASQALKEYEDAVTYYKAHLALRGTNLVVLNLVGECYFLLGNNEEALIAWEKSLELNPKQKEIEEKVRSIKSPRNK